MFEDDIFCFIMASGNVLTCYVDVAVILAMADILLS